MLPGIPIFIFGFIVSVMVSRRLGLYTKTKGILSECYTCTRMMCMVLFYTLASLYIAMFLVIKSGELYGGAKSSMQEMLRNATL